jgi:hypothetical protein
MTPLDAGCYERAKRAWHVGGALFAGGATFYNGLAWAKRREWHLFVNTVLYGVLTLWEYEQARTHCQKG